MGLSGGTLITIQATITHNFLIIIDCLFVFRAIPLAFLLCFIHPFIDNFGLFISCAIDDEISIIPHIYFKYFSLFRYFHIESFIPVIVNIDFINSRQY